jgi:hypothetical protein
MTLEYRVIVGFRSTCILGSQLQVRTLEPYFVGLTADTAR